VKLPCNVCVTGCNGRITFDPLKTAVVNRPTQHRLNQIITCALLAVCLTLAVRLAFSPAGSALAEQPTTSFDTSQSVATPSASPPPESVATESSPLPPVELREWPELQPTPSPVLDEGFLLLANQGVEMGQPVQPPSTGADGVVTQITTQGMAYWLPEQNQSSFTDGYNRWAWTSSGLVSWQGDSLTPEWPAPVPGLAPTPAAVSGSPRAYLYANYPKNAPLIACLIQHESNWNPNAVNVIAVGREHATGLAQFLPSTWMTTPQGRRGESIYNAYSQVDATAWMIAQGRGREWATWSACH
jgi:Transglycosylase SLT domain